LTGTNTGAYAISGNGQVVAGPKTTVQLKTLLWGITTTLDSFGNENYSASVLTEVLNVKPNALSEDGSVFVGQSDSKAARWSQTNGLELISGSLRGEAHDLTADGSTVVGYGYDSSNFNQRATIWDASNGWQSLSDVLQGSYGLDLTGWILTDARAISDDGNVIAGYGTFDGTQSAWVVNLAASAVPTPATVWLFGSGLLGLVGMARRKQSS